MQESKIRLSAAERELFGNAEIILTKNRILQKTAALLSDLQNAMHDEAPTLFRSASPPPKIARGENYLGLPYVILDYPRIAKGADLCFIRSMFWWGQFYSSTLQTGGKYKQENCIKLTRAYDSLRLNHYYVGIHQDPWIHHFNADNYRPVDGFSKKAFATLLEELPHTKIAARWTLNEWDSAANNLIESWRLLTGLIA